MPTSRETRFVSQATLPPDLIARLLGDVDVIARRMTRRVVEQGGLPPSFRTVSYLRSITLACRDALQTLLRLLRDGRGPRPGDLDRLGLMGVKQAEMGVPLEVLLSAYRLAARVVFEEVVGEAVRHHPIDPSTVVSITGQVLEYLDLISGAVGQAYLETREQLMRQRDRDRDRLLQRLLAGDTPEEFHHHAAAVDLRLQPPYHVIAVNAEPDEAAQVGERAWRAAGALVVTEERGSSIVLLPTSADVLTLRDTVEAVMRSAVGPSDGESLTFQVGLGPLAETLQEVATAARQARRALNVGHKLDPEAKIHRDVEVGVFAAMAGDAEAIQRFIREKLGPLAKPRTDRERELLNTLTAVVGSRSLGDAATTLAIHRHTLVYRVRQLQALGIDVEDAQARQQFWLALRLRRLL